jgi:hypothetical protein
LDSQQIAAIIEETVGDRLKSGKTSQPPGDYIRRDARYLWEEKEELDNDWYYWFTAE